MPYSPTTPPAIIGPIGTRAIPFARDRLRVDRLLPGARAHRRPVRVLRLAARAVPGPPGAASRRDDGDRLRRSARDLRQPVDVLVVQFADRTVPGLPGAPRRRGRRRADRAAPRRAA